MDESVFIKIRKGKIPSNIIYEDSVCFAILSIEPNNPGHILLIPNKQIPDWHDINQSDWLHMMAVAQKLAKVLKDLYRAPKVTICTVGFDINHTHVHIFPLFEASDINTDKSKPMPQNELARHAKKIKKLLKDL